MTKPKPAASAFDLSAFDTVAGSDRGAEVELLHLKTGERTGVFFKVLGSDSAEWREHVNERANKRLQVQFKAQRGAIKVAELPTIEEQVNDAILLLTRCTIGWRTGDEPTITWGDEELPFTTANALRVYTSLPAIRQQVDEFIGDMSNFI